MNTCQSQQKKYRYLKSAVVQFIRVGAIAKIAGGMASSVGRSGWLMLSATLFTTTITAQAQEEVFVPSPPKVNATSYVLYEPSTGTILLEQDSEHRLPPASLTKIMTSYVVANELAAGNITLEDEVPISVKAWRKGGSRMYVREGDKVPVEKLIKGMAIQSGNDASIALAEYVAGSESVFSQVMNKTARQLGMLDTNFSNATGWPAADHYTTAKDMVLLTAALINNHPEHYSVYSQKEYTYADITQQNRNILLWRDSSVDGVKTGHTEEAGYCLIASAKKQDMRLISVVLGTESATSRANESQKLLAYGFRFYEVFKAYEADVPLSEAKVWMGKDNTVPVGLDKGVKLTLLKSMQKQLKAEVVMNPLIKAPLEKGAKIGMLSIKHNDKILHEAPLVVLEAVEKGGIIKRLWHWIYLKVLGLFKG